MKRDSLTILLIALVASVMSISLYSTGQFWWDDFASYILQARAILDGRMAQFVAENGRAIAQSTYPVGPAAYPWGFPLLLAPVYALAGLSITAFKLLNTAAFAAFLIIFYAYSRQRFNAALSAALASVLAFNPVLLKAHDLIQADFSFLLATTASLFLIDLQWRTGRSPAWQKNLLGVLIFWSFLLRTNGILLLGPLVLVDFFQWRATPRPGFRLISLPYLTFLSFFGLSLFIFPGGQSSYFEHYELFFSPARLFDNFLFYLTLPGWLFGGLPLATLLFALTGLSCLWGIFQKARSELPVLAFSLLTMALFITWPERQGLRFIYPILPFFLVFAAHGLLDLVRRIQLTLAGSLPLGFFAALALLSLVVSFQRADWKLFSREEINGPFDPVSAEMFAYVREKTAADSTVIFFKPRLMKLMTDRYSILIEDCSRIGEGDLIVMHEKQERNGQIDPGEIKTCNPSVELQIVFKNQRFTIYQVLP
ncbi:MAG: hypothetical protein CVU44_23035 [Chloroflexi bacterium HGW-Chloroflexi-6]|nr:MAG: hypothetical protein CVU44_23035 [Chloroflexi bacterium HGW-Chloroflexi-6]